MADESSKRSSLSAQTAEYCQEEEGYCFSLYEPGWLDRAARRGSEQYTREILPLKKRGVLSNP